MTQYAEGSIDTSQVVLKLVVTGAVAVVVTALVVPVVLAVVVDVVLAHVARVERMTEMAKKVAVVVAETRAPRRPRMSWTPKWTITSPKMTARLLLKRPMATLVPRPRVMPRSPVLVTLT